MVSLLLLIHVCSYKGVYNIRLRFEVDFPEVNGRTKLCLKKLNSYFDFKES